jgi:hypothetical protein
MKFRAFLAAALAASVPAFATPQPRNATDMWFDPAESGWGLNVIHQGDTLFATLFVYGSDGQPKWFVASNVSGGPNAYSGALSECAGPWFGGPFSAGPVTCREVGPIRFEMGDRSAVVDYTVDGVRVSKQVQRFTFRPVTIAGSYEGAMVGPGTGRNDWTLQVRDNGTTVEMDASSDASSGCLYTGTPSFDGQFETVTGTYRCGTRTGPWAMTVDPTTEGFTGTFTGDLVTGGRIAAGRLTGQKSMQGHGWRNDMWFVPGESGWGFNVIEQGDTLFATLFVYDAQRRPRWYVASSLAPIGTSADGAVSYTGALFESTGPYFGTAFNPSAVTRREVGQVHFQARPDGRGSLMYSVDGVTVARSTERFAFRKQDFSGSYRGMYAHDRPAQMTIDDSGSTFRMRLVDEIGGMGRCDFTAPSVQVGSLRSMTGTYTCGSTSGSFVMQYATVSAHGFTARFDSPMFAFRSFVDGHISGARQ